MQSPFGLQYDTIVLGGFALSWRTSTSERLISMPVAVSLIHGSGDSQLVTSLVAGAIGCTLIQTANIARNHSVIIVKLMVAMIKDADGRLWYRAGI